MDTQQCEMPSVPSFTEEQRIFPFLQLQITAIRRNNTTNATKQNNVRESWQC